MKYLYQQLLAFWGVIALILLTLGFSFTQFTRQTMEDNNYQQLFGYARTIQDTTRRVNMQVPELGEEQAFQWSIGLTEGTLTQQQVNFVFVDKDKTIKYPEKVASAIQNVISDSQWDELQQGHQQKMTLPTNIQGKGQTTSYGIVPLFLQNSFYGVLIVSQPANNVDESVKSVMADLFKGFLISSIIALIFSYGYASFQMKRINSLRKATKEVTEGNFEIKLPSNDKDEFDDLANDFNKMTQSLKDSQEEINRQEERRKQFMADASHEMRTPLTTINGLLEGLQYNAIPENQKEKAIKLMQNETSRLIRLVNENLDYEKIRTNQIVMVIKKFNGTEALNNILTQLEAKAEAAGNELILENKEAVDVYADYDRFVQIMTNIIQNAIQFTENGKIYVSLEKGYLETIITIRDTGIGMSEEQVKNIWDRYYKADPSRKKTQYGESGLGLAIVEQLVKLHKGTIQVESQLGEGTTFIITFPDTEID